LMGRMASDHALHSQFVCPPAFQKVCLFYDSLPPAFLRPLRLAFSSARCICISAIISPSLPAFSKLETRSPPFYPSCRRKTIAFPATQTEGSLSFRRVSSPFGHVRIFLRLTSFSLRSPSFSRKDVCYRYN